MKQRLKLAILLLNLVLVACQEPNPTPGNSPLSAPARPSLIITCTLESAQSYSDTSLDSVRLTADYVFVSTENGLYRATQNERRWSQLHCPDNFPRRGFFANYVHATDPIILITDQGLFSTSDNGNTWYLISDAYLFGNAFLLSDETLYAIVPIKFSCAEPIHGVNNALQFLRGESWNRMCLGTSVLMSVDFGQNWHDITGNIERKFSLQRIRQDPDHPDLIILDGGQFSSYILQATDKTYHWQMYEASIWLKNHTLSSQDFFTKDYWTQTTSAYYELRATLNNYFDYNFGERAYLPGFDLLTDQAAYIFAPTSGKIITATIKFLPATDYAQLIDLKDSVDLWGVRLRDSTGHNIDQLPRLTQSLNKSADRQKLIQQYRGRPDFYPITIDHAQAYTRSIDLDDLFNLSVPGVYQVQLIYNNASIVDRNNGEWSGSFAGNVFTVTVTPP